MMFAVFILLLATIGVKWYFKLPVFSPPAIITSVWSIFTLASMLAFWDYPWGYGGLVWILLACIIFEVSYGLTRKYRYRDEEEGIVNDALVMHRSIIKAITAIAFVGALAYVYQVGIHFGVSMKDFLSLESLGKLNHTIAVARYSGGASYGFISRITLPFIYLLPMLGGILFVAAKSVKQAAVSFCVFLPGLMVFAMTNEKALLILSVFFWFGSFLTAYYIKNSNFPPLRVRWLAIGIGAGVLLLSVLTVSMMLRIGSIDGRTFGLVTNKITNSYALSHMPAFDAIFPLIQAEEDVNGYGKYTFFSIYNTLGVADREQGVYQDYFSYNEITTNVYTPFRGMIHDFGFVGALIFISVLGIISAWSVSAMRSSRPGASALGASVCVTILVLLTFWPISILSYASTTIALILYGVAIFVSFRGLGRIGSVLRKLPVTQRFLHE